MSDVDQKDSVWNFEHSEKYEYSLGYKERQGFLWLGNDPNPPQPNRPALLDGKFVVYWGPFPEDPADPKQIRLEVDVLSVYLSGWPTGLPYGSEYFAALIARKYDESGKYVYVVQVRTREKE
jgi:hypothetical protein